MLPRGSAGKRISKEEGVMSLIPSSTVVAGRLKQLNLNTQTESVCVLNEVDLRYCFIIITYGSG